MTTREHRETSGSGGAGDILLLDLGADKMSAFILLRKFFQCMLTICALFDSVFFFDKKFTQKMQHSGS